MHVPPYLQDHAPLHALYHGVVNALAPTPLGPHAEQLAFRAVLHASAWLGEHTESGAPYHAIETHGLILYHASGNQDALPALDAHIAALHDAHGLTRTGLATWAALNEHTLSRDIESATRPTRPHASSLWRNHLQLLTRYGLNFDQHFKSASDAA